jgi:transcription antitermination factor NusA-like protein
MTRIRTRFTFEYNNTLFFCVPKKLVTKAIGKEGKNVKQISSILKKKIKVIPCPKGIEDAKNFISTIVSPVEFKDLEVAEGVITINAGSQSKAALIGRNKRRLIEMQRIAKDFFSKDVKIQ